MTKRMYLAPTMTAVEADMACPILAGSTAAAKVNQVEGISWDGLDESESTGTGAKSHTDDEDMWSNIAQ
jgi:hypothetical protein